MLPEAKGANVSADWAEFLVLVSVGKLNEQREREKGQQVKESEPAARNSGDQWCSCGYCDPLYHRRRTLQEVTLTIQAQS